MQSSEESDYVAVDCLGTTAIESAVEHKERTHPLVLKSAQAQQTQMMGIVYSTDMGVAERYENGRAQKRWPVHSALDLVGCLDELVGEIASRRLERRYMQQFRAEHGSFLKRFADLKARVDALSE